MKIKPRRTLGGPPSPPCTIDNTVTLRSLRAVGAVVGDVERVVHLLGRVGDVGRVVGSLGAVARLYRIVGDVRVLRDFGGLPATLHVLAVRVFVEATLRHEERGDGARREAHGGRAGRDAAAPAVPARVVHHLQLAHSLLNAVYGKN